MDLEKLLRRVVFSIAVHNTDDHLRNSRHLLSPELPGLWSQPQSRRGLSVNICKSDNALSFDLSLVVAPFFRLTPLAAESILGQVRDSIR